MGCPPFLLRRSTLYDASCVFVPSLHPLSCTWQADAVKLCKSLKYENAGTVEFLVDTKTNKHYFMEVNARVQVEHPVSEMVTGIDIIRQQLVAAGGDALEVDQAGVRLGGWAVAPGFAGWLMQSALPGSPLLIGSAMKIAYDILLWRAFRQLKPPEER